MDNKFLFTPIIFIILLISSCGLVPTHQIAGSTQGWGNFNKQFKIISEHIIGSQQIRVVRRKNSNCKKGYQDHIELNGEINKDSSFIIKKELKNITLCYSKNQQIFATPVYMNSNGGKLADGIKIGLAFKKHGVNSIVSGGQHCASACAIAFLGAKFRSVYSDGKLMFHAPYTKGVFYGINCLDKSDSESKAVMDYYTEMIGKSAAERLFDRTLQYCDAGGGWTINADTARIFEITTK